MSQVSLPSQIGETENIMRSRQFSLCAALNRMPMPRSKPSTTTYMGIATPRIAAQRSGSQKAQPTYSVPKPNMRVLLIRRVEAGALCVLGRLPDLRPGARTDASGAAAERAGAQLPQGRDDARHRRYGARTADARGFLH